MKKVTLYWNHICVLHNQEKKFLEDIKNELLLEDILLEITYFGLGYPEHMSEYLAKPDAVLPDLIVSADLEVFEDKRIFEKYKEELYDLESKISYNDENKKLVYRNEKLIPFVSIPLVYYTKDKSLLENNYMELKDIEDIAIGGINNSAGRTIGKYLLQTWGKSVTEHFLKNAKIYDMPIQAYNAVRMNMAATSLVPSLYALRADETESFMFIPKEGPLLIPSYICARKSISEDIALNVIRKIINKEFCQFYIENGDLIVYPDSVPSRKKYPLCTSLNKEWLDSLNEDEFYEIYCNNVKNATTPFS